MQSPQCSEQLHQFTKLTTALNSAFLHIAHIAHATAENGKPARTVLITAHLILRRAQY